ncbi:MAG: dimethylarginine dimethylaminohydrolase family protein [Candidatus Heimdallarchaeota archaeon]
MSHYGINHESGTLKRVMVHHPGKELKKANINPVIHHFDQPVDIKRFTRDHQELMNKLTEVGVEVLNVRELVANTPEIIKQILQCPNLVFVRDSSTITNHGALLFRMGLPTRRLETPIIKAAHESLGVPIALKIEKPQSFEGGGIALLEDRTAVAGLCDRATQGALTMIGDYLLEEKLIDRWIELKMPKGSIHIDGEFAELPDKVAISYPEVIDKVPAIFRTGSERWKGNFVEWLREEGWDILEITTQECNDMAANFLTVAKDLAFHYTGNSRVMEEVNKRGIDVVQIPGEEMRKANGGIHCMTCPILRI